MPRSKREFVVQQLNAIELTADDGESTSIAAWSDVSADHDSTAAAERALKKLNLEGKFRIVAVCRTLESKTKTVSQLVYE